jgi:hypothetical protein
MTALKRNKSSVEGRKKEGKEKKRKKKDKGREGK